MPKKKSTGKTHLNPLCHPPLKLPSGLSVLDGVRKFVARYHGVNVDIVTPKTILDETLQGKATEEVDWWEFYSHLIDEFDVDVALAEGVEFSVQNVAAYIEAELARRQQDKKASGQ